MASVIEAAGPDLFEWYRRRVPGLPADRDFLHVIAGRPMINLSLLEDMMRHLGLPTALVADSIGGGSEEQRPINPLRALRSLPSLIRLGLAQVTAVVRAEQNRRAIVQGKSVQGKSVSSFGEALDDLHDAYVGLVTGMFPLSSAIGPPLALLRATGTLYEHAARHRTVTAELAAGMASLRAMAPEDRHRELQRFLDEFGHRGVYESDIARPRYRDDLDLLSTSLGQPTPTTSTRPPKRTLRGMLTWPLWLLASQPLAARELLRHDAMRRFADIRISLMAMARAAVERGQLRTADDLWILTVHEARRLDTGWQANGPFWSDREAERARLGSIQVPHVVGRFDDPASWAGDHLASAGELRGLPLTSGTIDGVAWVLDEPVGQLPPDFDRSTTILVARSLDAGWIGTLHEVAGVVAEIGGDLSHGSILVRELGLPAVTNVAGATKRIHTGQAIRLTAGAGVVELLEQTPFLEGRSRN